MTTQLGFVKLQSVIIPLGKQLIPQLLFVGNHAWRPCSLPCTMVHILSPDQIVVRVAFESEMNQACWIQVDTEKHRCIKHYIDGSALYDCEIEDAEMLSHDASFEHVDFRLRLYHHTNKNTVPLIFGSGKLLASPWNYEGSKQHEDTHFAYFTDVPAFDSWEDFRRVAMTDGGFKVGLEYDQPGFGVEIMDVPKRDRTSMDAKIELLIEPELIDQQPMLYHDQSIRGEGPAKYWELLHQHIFRVPIQRGGSIRVTNQNQIITAKEVDGLRAPDRILAGCAFQKGQMRVVFDETDGAGHRIVRDAGASIDPIERFLGLPARQEKPDGS